MLKVGITQLAKDHDSLLRVTDFLVRAYLGLP